MKIDEFATETQQLDEANPYGLMQRAGSAIMGKLGSTKAQASGDVGKRANELYAGFKNWALRTGVDMTMVPRQKLSQWLTSQNIPGKLPPTLRALPTLDLEDPEVSKTLWTALAQGAYGAAGLPAGRPTLGANYGIPRPPARPAPSPALAPTPAPTPAPTAYDAIKNELTAAAGSLTPAQKAELLNLLR